MGKIYSGLAFSFSLFCGLNASAKPLEDVLLYVKEHNPTVLSSAQTVEEQKGALLQQKADFIPDISLSGGYTKRTLDREGADATTHPKTLSLTARQALFAGGDVVYGYRASKMALDVAKSNYKSTVQTVLLNAVTAYTNLLVANEIVDLQKNQVNLLEEQLKATKSQFEQGEVTKTDVSQAEARLASAQANYVQAQGDKQVAAATLNRLVGEDLETLSWPKVKTNMPSTLQDGLDTALAVHPDVLASLATLTQRRYEKTQSQSDYYPQVDVVASHGYVDNDNTKGYRDNTVGVELSWSLFEGGRTVGAVRQAVARKSSAEQAYEDTRRQVKEAYIQAFHNYQTALAVSQTRKVEEKAATLAEEGVFKEHKLGQRSVLDLLDARQELLESRVNVTQAKGNLILTSYALLTAMGILEENI